MRGFVGLLVSILILGQGWTHILNSIVKENDNQRRSRASTADEGLSSKEKSVLFIQLGKSIRRINYIAKRRNDYWLEANEILSSKEKSSSYIYHLKNIRRTQSLAPYESEGEQTLPRKTHSHIIKKTRKKLSAHDTKKLRKRRSVENIKGNLTDGTGSTHFNSTGIGTGPPHNSNATTSSGTSSVSTTVTHKISPPNLRENTSSASNHSNDTTKNPDVTSKIGNTTVKSTTLPSSSAPTSITMPTGVLSRFINTISWIKDFKTKKNGTSSIAVSSPKSITSRAKSDNGTQHVENIRNSTTNENGDKTSQKTNSTLTKSQSESNDESESLETSNRSADFLNPIGSENDTMRNRDFADAYVTLVTGLPEELTTTVNSSADISFRSAGDGIQPSSSNISINESLTSKSSFEGIETTTKRPEGVITPHPDETAGKHKERIVPAERQERKVPPEPPPSGHVPGAPGPEGNIPAAESHVVDPEGSAPEPDVVENSSTFLPIAYLPANEEHSTTTSKVVTTKSSANPFNEVGTVAQNSKEHGVETTENSRDHPERKEEENPSRVQHDHSIKITSENPKTSSKPSETSSIHPKITEKTNPAVKESSTHSTRSEEIPSRNTSFPVHSESEKHSTVPRLLSHTNETSPAPFERKIPVPTVHSERTKQPSHVVKYFPRNPEKEHSRTVHSFLDHAEKAEESVVKHVPSNLENSNTVQQSRRDEENSHSVQNVPSSKTFSNESRPQESDVNAYSRAPKLDRTTYQEPEYTTGLEEVEMTATDVPAADNVSYFNEITGPTGSPIINKTTLHTYHMAVRVFPARHTRTSTVGPHKSGEMERTTYHEHEYTTPLDETTTFLPETSYQETLTPKLVSTAAPGNHDGHPKLSAETKRSNKSTTREETTLSEKDRRGKLRGNEYQSHEAVRKSEKSPNPGEAAITTTSEPPVETESPPEYPFHPPKKVTHHPQTTRYQPRYVSLTESPFEGEAPPEYPVHPTKRAQKLTFDGEAPPEYSVHKAKRTPNYSQTTRYQPINIIPTESPLEAEAPPEYPVHPAKRTPNRSEKPGLKQSYVRTKGSPRVYPARRAPNRLQTPRYPPNYLRPNESPAVTPSARRALNLSQPQRPSYIRPTDLLREAEIPSEYPINPARRVPFRSEIPGFQPPNAQTPARGRGVLFNEAFAHISKPEDSPRRKHAHSHSPHRQHRPADAPHRQRKPADAPHRPRRPEDAPHRPHRPEDAPPRQRRPADAPPLQRRPADAPPRQRRPSEEPPWMRVHKQSTPRRPGGAATKNWWLPKPPVSKNYTKPPKITPTAAHPATQKRNMSNSQKAITRRGSTPIHVQPGRNVKNRKKPTLDLSKDPIVRMVLTPDLLRHAEYLHRNGRTYLNSICYSERKKYSCDEEATLAVGDYDPRDIAMVLNKFVSSTLVYLCCATER